MNGTSPHKKLRSIQQFYNTSFFIVRITNLEGFDSVLIWAIRTVANVANYPTAEARLSSHLRELRIATLFPHHDTMEIKNPRRVLAVGAPESGVLAVLKGGFIVLDFDVTIQVANTTQNSPDLPQSLPQTALRV